MRRVVVDRGLRMRSRADRGRAGRAGTGAEGGQTALEYLGVLALVAVLIGGMVLVRPGVGDRLAEGLVAAICMIVGEAGCPGPEGSGVPLALAPERTDVPPVAALDPGHQQVSLRSDSLDPPALAPPMAAPGNPANPPALAPPPMAAPGNPANPPALAPLMLLPRDPADAPALAPPFAPGDPADPPVQDTGSDRVSAHHTFSPPPGVYCRGMVVTVWHSGPEGGAIMVYSFVPGIGPLAEWVPITPARVGVSVAYVVYPRGRYITEVDVDTLDIHWATIDWERRLLGPSRILPEDNCTSG